jgi:SM-20-related protein
MSQKIGYIESDFGQMKSQEIKVVFLLSGGHQYTVYLKSDEPLLNQLLTNLVSGVCTQNNNSNYLFQIPINEGRSLLSFSSENLIGIVTEPPIFIETSEDLKTAGKLKDDIEEIFPSYYLQIDNFLLAEEYQELLKYVIDKEGDFVPTSTSENESDYRKSMVLYSFTEFYDMIKDRLQKILPDVIQKLSKSVFDVSKIEAQITSHNDGNYYKIHNDNGSSDTYSRELTFVYYFYREPKQFFGGELLIYDSKIEKDFYINAETFKTVEPRNNSIVFFLSRYLHEVKPVICPSKAFVNSRFTINGWIHRAINSVD